MEHTTFKDIYNSIIPSDYFDYGGWNNNFVITAPHGGGVKPFTIPPRKYGVLLQDTYTRRLTKTLVESYIGASKPRYLISNIHRSRVDFNRDIEEGAQNNPQAIHLWNEWNIRLRHYLDLSLNRFPKILYIDIHSHNDSDKFELGYNLSAKNYRSLKNGEKIRAKSSIDSLGYSTYEMIFGPNSIKTSLENFGFKVYNPTGKEVYFNGGRNIEVYSGDGIGAIQIEIPVSVLKEDFDKCVNVLRYSIDKFRKVFLK